MFKMWRSVLSCTNDNAFLVSNLATRVAHNLIIFHSFGVLNKVRSCLIGKTRTDKATSFDKDPFSNVVANYESINTTLQRMKYTVDRPKQEGSKIKHLIKKHTCISRESLTPEIALHLITPSCTLWSSPLEEIPFHDPFWAFYWPGGQAVARYILDNHFIVEDRIILDVGSGCGAAAIAAAMSNARAVIANDIDPVAACAISLNSTLNNINIQVSQDQLIGEAVDVDVILVGDMFYDEEFSDLLVNWLQLLSKRGKQIYIGDPGRLPLKKYEQYFQRVVSYPLTLDYLTPGFSHVSVWKIR